MAYIGRGIQWGEFAKQRLGIAGGTAPLFDGTEDTWALDFTSNQNSLLVVLGGQIQEPGIDFTCPVGSNQLTFTTAPAAAAICYVIFLGQELQIFLLLFLKDNIHLLRVSVIVLTRN